MNSAFQDSELENHQSNNSGLKVDSMMKLANGADVVEKLFSNIVEGESTI